MKKKLIIISSIVACVAIVSILGIILAGLFGKDDEKGTNEGFKYINGASLEGDYRIVYEVRSIYGNTYIESRRSGDNYYKAIWSNTLVPTEYVSRDICFGLGDGTYEVYRWGNDDNDTYELYLEKGGSSFCESSLFRQRLGWYNLVYSTDYHIVLEGTETFNGRLCDKYSYYMRKNLGPSFIIDQETGACMKYYPKDGIEDGIFECIVFETENVVVSLEED